MQYSTLNTVFTNKYRAHLVLFSYYIRRQPVRLIENVNIGEAGIVLIIMLPEYFIDNFQNR